MARLLTEFGMGTSLRRADYTEAAARGLKQALWSNSINAAELMGFEKTDMQLDVVVGVQKPEEVDVSALEKIFPYGQPKITVIKGGLDVARPEEGRTTPTVMAAVSISVGFKMEKAQ